jgi:hypothetical protein
MNRKRRAAIRLVIREIQELIKRAEEIKAKVNSLEKEEQQYLDNVPRNFRESYNFEIDENILGHVKGAASYLNNANWCWAFVDAITDLEGAIQ